MAFKKDKQYWEYRLTNLKKALKGNQESLKEQTTELAINAHKSYIKTCKREIIEVKKELAKY